MVFLPKVSFLRAKWPLFVKFCIVMGKKRQALLKSKHQLFASVGTTPLVCYFFELQIGRWLKQFLLQYCLGETQGVKIGRLFLETVSRLFLIMTFSLANSEVVCEKLGNTGEALPYPSLPVIIPSAWQHTCRGGMCAMEEEGN